MVAAGVRGRVELDRSGKIVVMVDAAAETEPTASCPPEIVL
jgi:hypothetical protein